MLRSTVPRVSFTTSHMALMLRTTAPLLGGHGMHSIDRYKAAWDELPLTTFSMSRSEAFAWDWKCRYELGLRDTYRNSKMTYAMLYCLWLLVPVLLYGYAWPFWGYHCWYGEVLPQYNRENGPAYSKQFGVEVWCADGKFVTPMYHINPPMFTMTVEEL
jgi:hypothetical protein